MLPLLSRLHERVGEGSAPQLYVRALRRLGRMWLRKAALQTEASRPDDVTVVIGARNRADYRLVNALRSIRAQDHRAGSVRTIVVDWGSDRLQAERTREICRAHGAECVTVPEAGVWSRSRCLNVGIRRTDSKLLMTTDVDVVLSPGYLSDAARVLAAAPLSVVCAPMLDLPEESAQEAARVAASSCDPPVEEWKRLARPRYDWLHPSIALTYTRYYHLVRGYDEFYEVWGMEDDDLMRRFHSLGLTVKAPAGGSFYLHQWHPKFDGLFEGRDAPPIQRNREYLERHHSILRNGRDWGLPALRADAIEGA